MSKALTAAPPRDEPRRALHRTLVLGALIVALPAAIWIGRQLRHHEGLELLPFPASAQGYMMLDDVAGHLHRPSVELSYPWEEHPSGRLVIRTNNLGFREDRDTLAAKPEGVLRILVTGDSHIDGVVYNHESAPNRLEDRFGREGRSVEVINGGVGHYGPQSYLRFLRKHVDLQPDLYVVVLFTGNDFLDAVKVAYLQGEVDIPDRPPDYMSRLERAQAISGGAVNQGVNQLFFFKALPGMKEEALRITESQIGEIQRLCHEYGVELIVVPLPTKLDVEPETDGETLRRIRDVLELSDRDLAINREITEALLERLAVRGVWTVDPLEWLATGGRPLYWRSDYHLNVAGHQRLADVLYEVLADRGLDPQPGG